MTKVYYTYRSISGQTMPAVHHYNGPWLAAAKDLQNLYEGTETPLVSIHDQTYDPAVIEKCIDVYRTRFLNTHHKEVGYRHSLTRVIESLQDDLLIARALLADTKRREGVQ